MFFKKAQLSKWTDVSSQRMLEKTSAPDKPRDGSRSYSRSDIKILVWDVVALGVLASDMNKDGHKLGKCGLVHFMACGMPSLWATKRHKLLAAKWTGSVLWDLWCSRAHSPLWHQTHRESLANSSPSLVKNGFMKSELQLSGEMTGTSGFFELSPRKSRRINTPPASCPFMFPSSSADLLGLPASRWESVKSWTIY